MQSLRIFLAICALLPLAAWDDHISLLMSQQNDTSVSLGRFGGGSYCFYMMMMVEPRSIERSAPLRDGLTEQGLPYTIIPGRRSTGHWPVQCLKQPSGYIGNWRSHVAAWRRGYEKCSAEWIIVLENDVVPPQGLARHLGRNFATKNKHNDIVWMDGRHGDLGVTKQGPTGWGIGAVALRRTALPKLLPHFMDAPHAMWRTYNNVKKDVVDNPDCLTDWYLGNVVAHIRMKAAVYPLFDHPVTAPSEISG